MNYTPNSKHLKWNKYILYSRHCITPNSPDCHAMTWRLMKFIPREGVLYISIPSYNSAGMLRGVSGRRGPQLGPDLRCRDTPVSRTAVQRTYSRLHHRIHIFSLKWNIEIFFLVLFLIEVRKSRYFFLIGEKYLDLFSVNSPLARNKIFCKAWDVRGDRLT